MKTRIDRDLLSLACAGLCIFAVGCDMDLPDWWPGVDSRSTSGGDTSGGDTSGGDTSDDADVVDDGTDVQQVGALRVLITDKPYPLEFISEALVTITRVEVHRIPGADDVDTNGLDDADTNGIDDGGTNGISAAGHHGFGGFGPHGIAAANSNGVGNGDCTTNGDCQLGPWITIFEGQETFDLLQLRNGQTDLLADADIPAGTYDQMRLIVTEGQITLIDGAGTNGVDGVDTNGSGDVDTNGVDDVGTNGRVFSLRVPSGEQTGIKLHFTFEIVADQETTLLLDVDLTKVFKPVPGGHIDDPDDIREFLFRPSLGMQLINVTD